MMNEREVFYEAMEILMEHLSPEKFAKFWASCNSERADYLKIKEQLFKDETVETLYDKIENFQNNM